jgi:4'-phosphopantetheinyl transferase EntD
MRAVSRQGGLRQEAVIGGRAVAERLMRGLLPAAVVAVESFGDIEADLYPEERPAVDRAVDKRRREFVTTRALARTALAGLGLPSAPIPRGEAGAPGWPDGVVGSLTHCAGYRAAAVARRDDVRTVGIDAEPNEPVPDGVLETVADDGERAAVAALAAGAPDVAWDRLLFSAKESVYKAWYPLTGRWLDFLAAEVTIEPAGAFTAALRVPGPVVDGAAVTAFAGRWVARRGLLATAVAVPARPRLR